MTPTPHFTRFNPYENGLAMIFGPLEAGIMAVFWDFDEYVSPD